MKEQGSHRAKMLQQKQALERKLAALDARERERERKRETRRKIIAGAIVLKHAQENAPFAKTLFELLNRFVLKRDRHLFDLPECSEQTRSAQRHLFPRCAPRQHGLYGSRPPSAGHNARTSRPLTHLRSRHRKTCQKKRLGLTPSPLVLQRRCISRLPDPDPPARRLCSRLQMRS